MASDNFNYTRIARAIEWISDHRDEQPDLSDLAKAMGMSPHHLQRTFQAWAGLSPKQFLKALTRESAVQRLRAGESVLEASINSGLSGPGRLHDLTISTDALTPGEIRRKGHGVSMEFGIGDTMFGRALISWSHRGINFLGFCEEKGETAVITQWRSHWRHACCSENARAAQKKLDEIFAIDANTPVALWLRGSPFQLKVWEALVAVPSGQHASYGDIASYIRRPKAARAVGTAIGDNPVAWIIPCHRVIRKTGELGGYRWGDSMKTAMIAYEASRSTSGDEIAVSL